MLSSAGIPQSLQRTDMPTDIAMLMRPARLAILPGVACLLFACGKEVPPRSVSEFVENPILLEATMVRCAQNRAETKYDAECVNAREAINRIEAAQDQARRKEFEAQSEQKRQALRRTQEAAAEARRRAADAQRRREEAAYLGQFDAPPETANPAQVPNSANPALPVPPANAPGVQIAPEPAAEQNAASSAAETPAPADLEAIREELKRRQDESQ
jgi:hypothetical protein